MFEGVFLNPTNHFLSFFCLVCKLFNSNLQIKNPILDIFRCVGSAYIIEYLVLCYKKMFYTEKLFSTVSHFLLFFCWLIYCTSWISLSYATYFTHVQESNHRFCFLLVFSLMEISILTIMYLFSFRFLRWSLRSGLPIIHLISELSFLVELILEVI